MVGGGARSIAEVVLSGRPDDVPRVRRFVRSSLAGEPESLVADTELVVTELATNAALHGEPPITVRASQLGSTVRVEVEDAGRAMPVPLQQRTDAMTGRGLSLVAALASSWGVEPGATGKIVWAELSRDQRLAGHAPAPHLDVESMLQAWAEDGSHEPTYTVRLGSVPTQLLLSAKSHIDNVVRELTLLREGEASTGVALAPELAALVRTVMVDFADARTAIKAAAAAAAGRGDADTDLELHLPLSSADAAGRYLAALDEADRYARSAHLLTLAPPRSHRVFRRWYVGSIVEQLRAQAAGRQPPAPSPFPAVLAAEVDRLADLEDVSARLALLQKVSTELADAASPEEMATIVVSNAGHFLGVETARAYLMTPQRTLRSVAWYSVDKTTGASYDEFPIDSDVAGAVVARTGKPLFMRSLDEIYAAFPDLAGAYPHERSLHVVPLSVRDQTLGLLALTFLGGELADETQVGFVQSLAGALAQALKRIQLAASDSDNRGTVTFLADATEIMLSALEPSQVLEHLVNLAVPRIGDWCTVYLADGEVLKRVAMAIAGFPELSAPLMARTLSLDLDLPQTRAFRSGVPEPVPTGLAHLVELLYPEVDFAAIGGDPGSSTGVCVPIKLRGECIGVVGLSFVGSGRQVTPSVVDSMYGLAAAAAIALDHAQRWNAQQQVVRALVAALLPLEPPAVEGLEFASRYLPAGGDVAGDWWEADLMPDGTALIGLGDAAGHGIDAVSMMCELRHGARALAVVEPSPAALLADLNRRLAAPDAGFATALYGRLDPATGRLRWASAGHVPALHVSAAGQVTTLEPGSSSPLGSPGSEPGRDHVLILEEGDVLVLYSDGVVERRDRDLGEGISRLAATVSAHAGASLGTLADLVFAEHCADPLDDCCLLLVRRKARH